MTGTTDRQRTLAERLRQAGPLLLTAITGAPHQYGQYVRLGQEIEGDAPS